MDFKQIYVSKALSLFEPGIKQRWNLHSYTNPNEPAVFFGTYSDEDIQTIYKHNSYGILINGGNDLHNAPKVFERKGDTFFTFGYAWYSDAYTKWSIPHKKFILPIKDFSPFNCTPLGSKIYVYIGQPQNKRQGYFRFEEDIRPLMKEFGEDRFIWVKQNIMQPIPTLINQFYNKCFVYVKPNPRGGSTSMWELAHMGRKTIAQNQGGAPNVLEYKDLNDIINLIYQEEKKIGTIQEQVSKDTQKIFMNKSDWLTLDFWKS